MEFNNLSIMQASEKHLFEVLHVLNQATLHLHQKGNMQWDYPWDKEDILPDIKAGHAYVVVSNYQTIGTFFIKEKDKLSNLALEPGSLYLYQIAILPEFQGQGLGSQIIEYAKNLTRSLYLDCWAGNKNLIEFYVQNGFEQLGNHPEKDYFVRVFKFSTAKDDIKMMKDDVLNFAKKLLAIDSPSGYCMNAIQFVKEEVERLGYATTMNAKGNLIIDVPGQNAEGSSKKTVGLSAHVDTLGLMVRSIKGDGTLTFTPVGGPILPTYDGEYCRIYTRDGKVYTGTIVSNQTSVHVHKEASTAGRNADNMHIRIDERVKSKDDVIKLGIQNGDFIAIETKTQVTDSGFIKSRFLDDKISVSCLVGILAHLKENQIPVRHHTKMIISTYEEVGHGSSQIPAEIEELIAVDMGCIGEDLACTEYDVSICAKDSSGPYDYELTSKLIELAKSEKINYVVDIYPMYGSDVSAALRGGNDIRGALIGPGVAASHGMERTHWDGVESTIKLLLAYLQQG